MSRTRLSRLRFLVFSAATATVSRGVPARPTFASVDEEAYQKAFERMVAKDRAVRCHLEPGRERRLDPEPALHPSGTGDEEMIVRALANVEPGVAVVNLSLGRDQLCEGFAPGSGTSFATGHVLGVLVT